MSTIRVERRRRFTTIDRRTVNDQRLSFRARGILLWLLDKPDNWTATREAIAAASPDGIHAVRSALQELTTLGYLVRTKTRQPNGRMITETVVHECPPEARNPPSDNRPADNRPAAKSPVVVPRLIETTTETETTSAPPAKGPQTSPEADRIARAEWERRDRKPICGFPALRARIQDVLDAGHPASELERVLPSMDVFTRNSFDLALRRTNGNGANGHKPSAVERSWANAMEVLQEMGG